MQRKLIPAILGTVLAFGMGFAIAFFVIFGMRTSVPYEMAVQAATRDRAVNQALGEPVRPGWWVMGEIETSPNSGSASMTVPLTGANGRGRLNFSATKSPEGWALNSIVVRVNGTGDVITVNPDR
ncbi:MAG: hypothetical protein GYB64_02240 [Chloroflexi bacterium]|nr:hypothetical protein [Chloroflexota bacterium]